MTFHWPTFVFQMINFVVLAIVLYRLLWKPLRQHMERRADGITQGLAEVAGGRAEIEQQQAEIAELQRKARMAETEALKHAEAESDARRAEILQQAHIAAAQERDRIVAQATRELQRREQEFLNSLTPLIAKVVQRLIEELGGPRLHELACDRFADSLEALPQDKRAHLKESAATKPLNVATANGSIPSRLQTVICSFIPDGKMPAADNEPRLLAGAQLRIGDTVMDGSVRAQVARALAEME